MGCGPGMSCWRRLKGWHEAGVWKQHHRVLLDRLSKVDRIDWGRASLDSASVPTLKGAKRSGESCRSRRTGFQAPSSVRRGGRPARAKAHRDQCTDLYDVRGDGGHHSADLATPRPTEAASPDATRRQGLRGPGVPKGAPPAGIKAMRARKNKESSEKRGRHRWRWWSALCHA